MRLGHFSILWGRSAKSFLPSSTILAVSVEDQRAVLGVSNLSAIMLSFRRFGREVLGVARGLVLGRCDHGARERWRWELKLLYNQQGR